MKANKGKCHFLISGSENILINVDGNVIEKSNCEKLLGEKIFVLVLKNFYLFSVYYCILPDCFYCL